MGRQEKEISLLSPFSKSLPTGLLIQKGNLLNRSKKKEIRFEKGSETRFSWQSWGRILAFIYGTRNYHIFFLSELFFRFKLGETRKTKEISLFFLVSPFLKVISMCLRVQKGNLLRRETRKKKTVTFPKQKRWCTTSLCTTVTSQNNSFNHS